MARPKALTLTDWFEEWADKQFARLNRLRERERCLKCSLCPPHRGENAGRRAKRGAKMPRYKNKRA